MKKFDWLLFDPSDPERAPLLASPTRVGCSRWATEHFGGEVLLRHRDDETHWSYLIGPPDQEHEARELFICHRRVAADHGWNPLAQPRYKLTKPGEQHEHHR